MPNPRIMEWVVACLWGLMIVAMAWTWVPALLSALGRSKYEDGGTEDPTDLVPEDDEPEYAYWFDQLRDLGYAPMGTGFVRIIFAGDRWVSFGPMRVFHSQSAKRFAYVHQGDPPFDFWGFVSFVTILADGGLVITSNVEVLKPVITDEYIRVGVETQDLRELEQHHQRLLERWRQTQYWPDPDQSLDNLLRATREQTGEELKDFHRRSGRDYLIVNGIFHFFVSLPTAWVMGLDHWGVPVSNLVLYGVMRFGQAAQQVQLASMLKERLFLLRQKQIQTKRGNEPEREQDRFDEEME